MTVVDFRQVLRGAEPLELAALMIELGFELYRRDVGEWRGLNSIADTLIAAALVRTRERLHHSDYMRWLGHQAAIARGLPARRQRPGLPADVREQLARDRRAKSGAAIRLPRRIEVA